MPHGLRTHTAWDSKYTDKKSSASSRQQEAMDQLNEAFHRGYSQDAETREKEIDAELEAAREWDQNKPAGDFAELIVKVDRVQKVTRGGVIMQVCGRSQQYLSHLT